MTSQNPQAQEVIRLASAALEGALDAEQQARLNALLGESEAARQVYVCFMQDSHCLRTWASQGIATAAASQPAAAHITGRAAPLAWLKSALDWRNHSLRFALLMLALTGWAWVWFFTLFFALPAQKPAHQTARGAAPPADRPVVARIIGMHGCRWGENSKSLARESRVPVGEPLELAAGDVEMRLENDVRAILHGPARMRLHSAEVVELDAGSLSVTLPRAVRQFEVLTPTARIIDLGTQFAVEASAAQTELHVLAGRVRVEPRHHASQAQVVTAGQAVQIGAEGKQLVSSVNYDAEQFITALPIAAGDLPVTAGLRLWLDATDETTLEMIGNEVVQWRDKSGGGNHASAVWAKKRPTYKATALGGRPALAFNRDQLRIEGGLPTIAGGQARTIFLVFDRAKAASQSSEIFGTYTQCMIDVGTAFHLERVRLRDVFSNGVSGGEDGGGGMVSAEATVPAGPRILTVLASDDGSTQGLCDGKLILDTPDSYAHYPLNVDLGIGGALFNQREYVGYMSGVLVYDRALSRDELQAVNAYLIHKYDLQPAPAEHDSGDRS